MFHKFMLIFLILFFSQQIANGCDQSLPVVDLTSLDAAENLCVDHVISTWRRMTNLESNFEYL